MKNLSLYGIDVFTKQEAKTLGVIDNENGLGFVSPKTAFRNVNEAILTEIKKGNLIWRKGWRMGVVVKGKVYGVRNHETQRPYSGANAFFIEMFNNVHKTEFVEFLTKKQIEKHGWKLKKEAKPFPLMAFVKNTVAEKYTDKDGEEKEFNKTIKGVVYYTVFPVQYIDGFVPIEHKEETDSDYIEVEAQQIIDGMPKAPEIKHGGDRAFYIPSNDFVQMPFKKAFNAPNEYYATLFHELSHSTGHKTRLGRNMLGGKGSKDYAFEELIAELSASYLCTISALPYYNVSNTAAYLKSWAQALEKEINADPHFLQRAVFKATKAATYILGKTLEKSNNKKSLGNMTDFGNQWLSEWIDFHGKVLNKFDLGKHIEKLANAKGMGKIDSTHPLRTLINEVSEKITKAHNALNANET
ncbi:MAG: DUF1738 domain-containing protein, partial [Bacteroidetes bacterium]|nr:DUF1738 domain-containing protein [Bacteroidota bacterium]